MTHFDRYESLMSRLGDRPLDASYRAAVYILASEPELTYKACDHLNEDGIFFDDMLEKNDFYDTEKLLVDIAHNLFRQNTKAAPSPYQISQLGYPHIDVVIQAIYIASGLHSVQIASDAEVGLFLKIDSTRHKVARKCYQSINDLINWHVVADD